ncbi:MAG: hypothetical protein IKV54_07435, partial [Clostridia bacterium]|nr:hypothetical protein [Clostridia bacterium]
MRKLALVFSLLLAVLLLYSCHTEADVSYADEDPVTGPTPREKLIDAHNALKDRISETISLSFSVDKDKISEILYGTCTQSNTVLEISRLDLLSREMIKTDRPLTLTLDTIKNGETARSQSTVTLNYGDESLAFVNYRTENGKELIIPDLTDTVLINKKALSLDALLKDVLSFIASEENDKSSFREEITSYRKDDVEYPAVTAVSFDTDDRNCAVSTVTAYFDGDSPFALSYTARIGGSSITFDLFFPPREKNTDSICVSAERAGSSDGIAERIFYLSFNQTAVKKSSIIGRLRISANTEALSKYGISIPVNATEITVDSVFDTKISGTKSSCLTSNRVEYTIHGIKKALEIPLQIYTDTKDGDLSSSVMISYSDDELTAFEGILTTKISVSKPHTVISHTPADNSADASIDTKKQEYISKAEKAFFENYPKLSSLLPYGAQKGDGPDLSLISAFSPKTGCKYLLYYDGSGEYNGSEITEVQFIYLDGELIAT